MMKKNKKGNIPITILVIGVVAICVLALGSFAFSSFKLNKSFNLGVFEDIYSDMEDFYFYINQNIAESEAATSINAEVNGDILIIEREVDNLKISYRPKIK